MLLPAQADPEFAIARGLGMLVAVLIPVTFALYALRSLGDPDRSRKCALSLALIMGGWALSSLSFALSQLIEAPALVILAGLVAVPLGLAGIVMAILGLVDVAGSARPKSGRGQAITTLILGGLVLLVGLIGSLMDDGVPDGWRFEGALPPGERLSDPAKNFSLLVPAEEWVQVFPEKLNRQADIAFVDPKRKLSFILLAHALPAGASITPEKFLEIARNEVKRIDAAARLGEPEPEAASALPGVAFSADARAAGKDVTYRVWLYPYRNHAYQLVLWGPRRAAETVQLEASRFVKGFEILAP
jgi:hypothetical protein